MDDHRSPLIAAGTTPRTVAQLLLGAALLAVATLTLTQQGTGWTWASPLVELRWYATGLDSPDTVRQLVGNLGLLVVLAVLVARVWPAAGRASYLTWLALGAAAGIELLQWALPLGRVVSPLDAALNALGAVAGGLLARHLQPAGGPSGVPAEPALAGQAGVTS